MRPLTGSPGKASGHGVHDETKRSTVQGAPGGPKTACKPLANDTPGRFCTTSDQVFCLCRRGDLNPHELCTHQALNLARLPIPPLRRGGFLMVLLAPQLANSNPSATIVNAHIRASTSVPRVR